MKRDDPRWYAVAIFLVMALLLLITGNANAQTLLRVSALCTGNFTQGIDTSPSQTIGTRCVQRVGATLTYAQPANAGAVASSGENYGAQLLNATASCPTNNSSSFIVWVDSSSRILARCRNAAGTAVDGVGSLVWDRPNYETRSTFQVEATCPETHADGLGTQTGTAIPHVRCLSLAGGVGAIAYADALGRDANGYKVRASVLCPTAYNASFLAYRVGTTTTGQCLGALNATAPGVVSISWDTSMLSIARLVQTTVLVLMVFSGFGIGWWFSSRPRGGLLD